MRAPSGTCAAPSSLRERGKRQHEQMDELLARSSTPMGEHGILTASNNQLTRVPLDTHPQDYSHYRHCFRPETWCAFAVQPVYNENDLHIMMFFWWSKVFPNNNKITVTTMVKAKWSPDSFQLLQYWIRWMILAKFELNYLPVCGGEALPSSRISVQSSRTERLTDDLNSFAINKLHCNEFTRRAYHTEK